MFRILEYFDGVIFLTTNRVMKLDIATLSCIHYAIHFTEVTKDQECGIWNEQLRQLGVKNGNVTSSERKRIEKQIDKYLQRQRGAEYNHHIGLNGREIHNVFKTAQHAANGDDRRKITAEDLEEAIEAIQNFRSKMRERVEKAERQLVAKDEQPNS
jgi:AAA+ superfamily predicted ATPase